MKALSFTIAFSILGAPAGALVTDGGPPPENVAALARCVAKVRAGTGVYIGGRRMVTAAHVHLGLTSFDGDLPIRFVAGSWRRIGASDLAVFRLSREPEVPVVPIRLASVSPKPGERVWLIGTGWRRGALRIEAPTGKFLGWEVVTSRQTLVGQATVCFGPTMCANLEIPSICFSSTEGAQTVSGDSGGGAFVFRGGSWELVGVISHGYRPLSESGEVLPIVAGTASFMVDVASYREALAVAFGGWLPAP